MRAGFTDDPGVALTGLVSIALLGYLSWMVWQAGHVVRRSWKDADVNEASGA